MFKNSLIWVLAAFLGLAVVACEQEDLNFNFTENGGEETIEGRHPRGHKALGDCFDFVFPITVSFPDGTTTEAEDEEALKELMKAWRMDNRGAEEKPTFVMPFDIETEDGETLTIETEEAFQAVLEECKPEEKDRKRRRGGLFDLDCFEPVFPLSFTFPDGETTEVADLDALKEAFKAWKEANPDVEGRPELVFPIDVTLKDGTVSTIEDEEALRALVEECLPERERCFELVFPVTVAFPDATTTEAADRDALKELFETWKEANPDVEGRPEVVFPYDVTLEDGSTITVNSLEDIREIKRTCRPDRRDRRSGRRGGRGGN